MLNKSAFPVTVENDEQRIKVATYAKDNGVVVPEVFIDETVSWKRNYPFLMDGSNGRLSWSSNPTIVSLPFSTFLERIKELLFEVECVDAEGRGFTLTESKKYGVFEDLGTHYRINDDRGESCLRDKSRFKRIESRKPLTHKHKATGKILVISLYKDYEIVGMCDGEVVNLKPWMLVDYEPVVEKILKLGSKQREFRINTAKPGDAGLEIKMCSGQYIDGFMIYRKMDEIFSRQDSKFKVMSVEYEGETFTIEDHQKLTAELNQPQ